MFFHDEMKSFIFCVGTELLFLFCNIHGQNDKHHIAQFQLQVTSRLHLRMHAHWEKSSLF